MWVWYGNANYMAMDKFNLLADNMKTYHWPMKAFRGNEE